MLLNLSSIWEELESFFPFHERILQMLLLWFPNTDLVLQQEAGEKLLKQKKRRERAWVLGKKKDPTVRGTAT